MPVKKEVMCLNKFSPLNHQQSFLHSSIVFLFSFFFFLTLTLIKAPASAANTVQLSGKWGNQLTGQVGTSAVKHKCAPEDPKFSRLDIPF